MVEEFLKLVPSSLLSKSGSVFYSGKVAFKQPSFLYVLGLNPGGDVVAQRNETVQWHSNKVLSVEPDTWSAYRDESWAGRAPGTVGMQPRVLHMFEVLGLNPGTVPSSNIVFLRSTAEADIAEHFDALADACWPFHSAVISKLAIRVVVCFGKRTGAYVCSKLNAQHLVSFFEESNNRKWRSQLYVNDRGMYVATLTHPSRVDWSNPAADPSGLVKQALELCA